jgi:flagellar basal-body rod modification protein FlgD
MTISNTGSIPTSVLASINGTSTSTNASSKASDTSSQGIQDRFLTLLVTQLQNQDPLNPMDNAQITTQLAQISTVDGISQLNTTVQSLLSSNADTQTLQAAALMGHSVLVAGNGVDLSQGQAKAGFELSGSADSVTVAVKDAAGNAVTTLNLGTLQAGIHTLAWDGSMDNGSQAPDGRYSLSVTASQGGVSVDATALSAGVVSSVARSSSGVSINLGNQGNVGLGEIKQIL